MTSAPSPTIRPVTIIDVPALAELGAATFTEAFAHLYAREDLSTFLAEVHSETAWDQRLREAGVAVWLASIDAAPAGFVVAGSCKLPVTDLEPGAGEIHQLYVRASFQKHRLGTRLLETALAWLVSQQQTPLYVGVWSENFGAQRLYQRFGFEKIGEYQFSVGRQLDREFIFRQRVRA